MNLNCTANSSAKGDITLKDFVYRYIRLTEESDPMLLGSFGYNDLNIEYSCENFWTVSVNGAGIIF